MYNGCTKGKTGLHFNHNNDIIMNIIMNIVSKASFTYLGNALSVRRYIETQ